MPKECRDGSAALIINREGKASEMDEDGRSMPTQHWWITACVPEYTTSSRFRTTANKQTITETLYLDMYSVDQANNQVEGILKVTVNTTLGYFELPNYANGDKPGPLLYYHELEWSTNQGNRTDNSSDIEFIVSKGPLLKTVYALFGNGSMPAIYAQENATYNVGESSSCLDIVPLVRLFEAVAPHIPGDWYAFSHYAGECLTTHDIEMGLQMHYFISNFFLPPPEMVARVFRAAAYMSHSLWLQDGSRLQSTNGLTTIVYDKGIDFQKPGLTNGSLAGLTAAISVFLLALVTLAFYASVSRSWTSSLDSYALLRIGADLGRESLPFFVARDVDQIVELDELPGWVGDVAGEGGGSGQLGMGLFKEVKAINSKKEYKAYEQRRRGWWWKDLKNGRAFSLREFQRTRASYWARRASVNRSEAL